MADVAKLKASRQAYQGHMTRVVNEIAKADEHSADYELQSLSTRLCSVFEKIKSTSDGIFESLTEPTGWATEIDIVFAASDSYDLSSARINSLIIKNRAIEQSKSPEKPRSPLSSSHDHGLPQQSLPSFAGGLLEWRPFWDRFSACVHLREIPHVRKFTYLLPCLKGEAADAVSHLPLTEKNYSVAIDTLEKRYGDPALLIGLYAERLVESKEVKDGDTRAYRRLLDSFKGNLEQIEHLNQEVQAKSGRTIPPDQLLLSALLVRRLPHEARVEWSKKTAAQPLMRFDVAALMEFASADMISRSEYRDESKPHSSSGPPQPQRSFPSQAKPRNVASVSTFMAKAGNNDCPFCGGPQHSAFRCDTFLQASVGHRSDMAKNHNRCFNCLGAHSLAECKSKLSCTSCNKKHHSLLHWNRSPQEAHPSSYSSGPRTSGPPSQSRNNSPPVASGSTAANHVSSLSGQFNRSVLQTALIRVHGCSRLVRVMFDGGAERSYVSQHLVGEVGPLHLGETLLRLETFGGAVTPPTLRSLVQMEMASRQCDNWMKIKLIVLPTLCHPTHGVSPTVLADALHDVDPASLADSFDGYPKPIDMIIGMDAIPQIVTLAPPSKRGSLLLTPTAFGLLIGGTVASHSHESSVAALSKVLRAAEPADSVSSLWDLDFIGVPSTESVPEVVPVKTDDRYECSLPWLDERRPNLSLDQARLRLTSFPRFPLERKMKYVQTFKDYEELGILEPASSAGGNFIPHHGIVQKDKLRIVYDASASPWKGPSLNSCLSPGPNLLSDLTSVLLRFRTFPFPLVGDVEKAFLMVGVQEQDREFLKIAWLDEDSGLHVSRFTRVCFGLSCGPYLLLATLRHHFDQFGSTDPHLIQRLKDGLYMDDEITGASTEAQVVSLKVEAEKIFSQAGMRIRGFLSVPEVQALWDTDKVTDRHSVLGMPWSPASDEFCIALNLTSARTRREVLSAIARIFDPLGLISPWVIKLKIFFQSLWSSTPPLDWDSPLPSEASARWSDLVAEIPHSPFEVCFPRFLPMDEWSELHVFADASSHAYAAVVYVKTGSQAHLLCARARLAPLKPLTLTIPRLELMANLLAARLAKFCIDTLRRPSMKIQFYTDSMIALGWIRGEPSQVFSRNRVKEIRSLFPPSLWTHVSGNLNPADLPSRGISPTELDLQEWRHGPEFLESADQAPPSSLLLAVEAAPHAHDPPGPLVVENYSSYRRLFRTVAWIRRFIHNRVSSRSTSAPPRTGGLSVAELEEAKLNLLRLCQHEHGLDDVSKVKGGADVLPSSALWNARPFWDPDLCIVMCRPRHGGDPLPWLPCPSPLAKLIVKHIHHTLYHMGPASSIVEILRAYWVTKCRSFVRRVLSECTSCRRIQSRSFKTEEGGLPPFRVEPSVPFSHCGLDHFGPLRTKEGKKCYVLIFTCAVVRAVHLELVPSLNASDTVMAIRRFVARRGVPKLFISDNGPSFVHLSKSLQGFLAWQLIPPSAPWWGGFWERMIGTIKRSCKKTVGNSSLALWELITVIVELEDRINRRPLVQQEDNVLSPAHFLLGVGPPPLVSSGIPPGALDEANPLERRWQHRRKLSRDLWTRWTKDYLATLRDWRRKSLRSPCPLSAGDVVVVAPPDGIKLPRSTWPLALVLSLIPGRDGRARSANLRMRGRETSRPISRLYPLESSSERPRV